ncbi:MAG: hypothetical protein KGI38_11520, partial [Thaumarchaeota archaeon]|nr:hypothetical protein [Nitrososphaerota archaeon]
TLAVTLAIGILAVSAQLSRTQYATFNLSPTETTTVTSVALGTLTGGASGSQTFKGVIAFTISSGTHTITATLLDNDTLWQSISVYILNTGGQQCQLQGGSAVSHILSCSWTISSSQTYDETYVYTPTDGYAVSNQRVSIGFVLS